MTCAIIDMPTPEPDADGRVDLGPIVEAARRATDYPREPDPGFQREIAERERQEGRERFAAAMSEWHGVPVDRHGDFVPQEQVVLVRDRRTEIEASLARDARGLWMWGLRAHVARAIGHVPLSPAVETAWTTREGALADAAYEAWVWVRDDAPRYVRIIADLSRQAGVDDNAA